MNILLILQETRSIFSNIKGVFLKFYYLNSCRIKLLKWQVFDQNLYKDKRIIIIGPASSSTSYMPGEEIDKFDYIVRINKSTLNLFGKEKFLGSRTDILYHCLDEDRLTGGGPIDKKVLDNQNNKFILYTYAEPRLEYNFYRMISRNKYLKFYKVSPKYYYALKKKYSAKIPSTGLQALNHILSCEFKELHITGFTFFKTSYSDGYVDIDKSESAAYNMAKSSGNHDPDDELRIFSELYHNHPNIKSIFLDSILRNMVSLK